MVNTKDEATASQATGTQPVTGNGIQTSRKAGPINVDDVFKSDFQKEGTLSAQLRQVVEAKSLYPSRQVSNNMQDNIFSQEEFGFKPQEFLSTENRVAWLDVPVGTTIAQVMERLQQHSESCLYRVLSNHPVLTDAQKYAIEQGLRTYDEFADTQVIRYPEGTTKPDGKGGEMDVTGQIVLDRNGKVQYRRIFFSASAKEDMDQRTADATDFYASVEVANELKGASSANTDQKIS